jgi:outer membrane protein
MRDPLAASRPKGARALLASVLAVACTGGITLVVAPPARANDLMEAFHEARANDPVLAAADAQRGSAHALADIAAAALRPQASALAGVAHDRDSGASLPTTTDRSTNVSLGVSQVIFDAGLFAQHDATEANAAAGDATWHAAEQALVLRVAEAYIGVLLAADALATAQANEAAYDNQVNQSAERVKDRLAAQVDVDQARVYQSLAHAGTVTARQSLADAQGVLAEITGTMPGALHPLRDALPLDAPVPADRGAWEQAAATTNPAVLAARLDVDAAERLIDSARAGHLPTLSAGLNLGRPTITPVPEGMTSGRLTTTVGLTLTVPLSTGGATQARVRNAVFQRDAARDALESSRRAAVRSAQESYRAVIEGAARVLATKDAVEAARRALAATRVGYEVGSRTITDLLLAIQALGLAQDASSLSRHQLVLARLRLQQAAGTLDEADLAAVDALLQS